MKRAAAIAGALAALAIAGRGLSRRESRIKLRTLEEILRSRNDNDPRLDRGFDALSTETKRLFRRKYRELPAERRNERGTIVYILGGGNLSAAEDWAFMRETAEEPPCLSLSDCSKQPAPGGGEAAAGDEVTLAYPSLVALKQAQRALEETNKAPARNEARGVIEAGKRSRARAVSRLAERLERRFFRP